MHRMSCLAVVAALLAALSAGPAYGQEVQKQDVEKEADEIVAALAKAAKDGGDEAGVPASVLGAARVRREKDPPLGEVLFKKAYDLAKEEKDKKAKWPNPDVGVEAARALIQIVAADSRPEWQENLLAALTRQWKAFKAQRDLVARRRTTSPADKLKRDQETEELDEQVAQQGAALLDEMLAVVDQWILEGRYDAAGKECVEAARLEKIDLKTGRTREIDRRKTLAAKMNQWKEKLDKSAGDVQARKDFIRGYVVYLDRPDEVVRLGLLVDATKTDRQYEDFRVCVPLAAREKLDEAESFTLGNQYYQWAGELSVAKGKDGTLDADKGDPLELFARRSMLRRAVRYYEEYATLPPGPKKQPGDWDVVRANLQAATKQLAELQGPVDLLRLVDLAKPTNSKAWARSGNEIVSSQQGEDQDSLAWFAVPVVVSTSYRLTCEFITANEQHFGISFPVGTSVCKLVVSSLRLGRFRDGDVLGKKALTSAGPHELTLEVTDLGDNKWGIMVWFDDPRRRDPALIWSGPASEVMQIIFWQQLAANGSFRLEIGKGEGFRVRKLVLQMFSGELVKLKD